MRWRFCLLLALAQIILAPVLSAQETPVSDNIPRVAQTADAAYLNPDLPIAERVEDLLARMVLDEKIGQMTLVEKNSIFSEDIAALGIGGLLSGGSGYPANNNPESWAEMVDSFQQQALQSRLRVPLIYGVDAVHGHNNVVGAVIFPHNIGLGAANNPELMAEIGHITAIETAATGIYWNYAPVVAVVRDIRWGRTYESYSENTDLVTTLGTAYLAGMQGDDLAAPDTILGTPKHFIGDGGTGWMTSQTPGFYIDQGDTRVDEETLRDVFLPPYIAAVENGARSIMISFSSWNGVKMHAQRYLITDVLKGELGFDGFVVSDWAGINKVSPDYYEAVVTAINAGIDMNMVPYDYGRFIDTMKTAIENGDISMERVDDAVRRILSVKFQMGLFENPFSNPEFLDTVGSAEHREVARQAVSESLVLLKNDNDTLPIAADTETIFVAGWMADNIGGQCGGWTIDWQGAVGDITPGTTILEAIEHTDPETTSVYFDANGKFDAVLDASGNPVVADVAVVVIGERPYAEGLGDDNQLALSTDDRSLIQKMRDRSDRLVVILISGRPLIITDEIEVPDAFVAAWLPGTEGQGVADVLFGYQPFSGKLSFTWPRALDQLPFDFSNLEAADPLFPFGYGLETEANGLPLPDAPHLFAPVREWVEFSNQSIGIRALVPAGWGSPQIGNYLRSNPNIEFSQLIFKYGPGRTEQQARIDLAQALGLDQFPDAVGTRETEVYTWNLYEFEVDHPLKAGKTIAVAVALVEIDTGVYVVGLMTDAGDYADLYESAFLTAVDSLVPLE